VGTINLFYTNTKYYRKRWFDIVRQQEFLYPAALSVVQ